MFKFSANKLLKENLRYFFSLFLSDLPFYSAQIARYNCLIKEKINLKIAQKKSTSKI